MRPAFVLILCVLLDLAVANICHIPCLYMYQCMLFYAFEKEMITMPWMMLYIFAYVPIFNLSWVVMWLYVCISYVSLYFRITYVTLHNIVSCFVTWMLITGYVYVIQPDIAVSWGGLWTQMVIFANIILAVVLRHLS